MRLLAPLTALALIFLSFCQTLSAQGIEFETGSWPEAIRKARKQRKLLFLHIDAPDCQHCNEVATKGFSSPALREKFAVNFVSYRTRSDEEVGRKALSRYEMKSTGSIFLDGDENLLLKHPGTTSFALAYLEAADKALVRRNETPIGVLEKQYASGNRQAAFLRNLVARRSELGLANDDVLDEYVRALPPDSLRTLSLQTFLFGQGPVLGSQADSVMHLDQERLNLVYASVAYEKAVETNNRIISKSAAKAIRERNQRLAFRTASFARATHQPNFQRGQRAFDWHLMNYHRGIADTAVYLALAQGYYNRHLMTVNVDSIRRLDEAVFQQRMAAPPKPGVTRFVAHQQVGQMTRELNEGAMSFVDMARRPEHWETALQWSARALEFSPEDSNVMDTHARLLYKLGRREEAITWMQKAIGIQNKHGFGAPGGFFETTLQKMKAGTL